MRAHVRSSCAKSLRSTALQKNLIDGRKCEWLSFAPVLHLWLIRTRLVTVAVELSDVSIASEPSLRFQSPCSRSSFPFRPIPFTSSFVLLQWRHHPDAYSEKRFWNEGISRTGIVISTVQTIPKFQFAILLWYRILVRLKRIRGLDRTWNRRNLK